MPWVFVLFEYSTTVNEIRVQLESVETTDILQLHPQFMRSFVDRYARAVTRFCLTIRPEIVRRYDRYRRQNPAGLAGMPAGLPLCDPSFVYASCVLELLPKLK